MQEKRNTQNVQDEQKIAKHRINIEWFFQNRVIRILGICLCTVIYILLNSLFNVDETVTKLLSDGVLAIGTALLADLLINFNYSRHIKEELYDVLTNARIMKEFIDSKYKDQIMETAMKANLGDEITEALKNNILDTGLRDYKKILRENFQFNIYLENSRYSKFYSADIQIVFRVPKHDDELELNVFSCKEQSEMKEKMKGILDSNRQLAFPMLLAKDIDTIDCEKIFNVNIQINDNDVMNYSDNKDESIIVKLPKSNEPVYIRIHIQTLLNKDENFFQEDILCIHKGYNLTFGYESDLLKDCKCYHSCKSRDLVTVQSKNSINIQTSGILLPENNFVFIWEK